MANPAGTNSPVAFDQFTREIPYGEKKVQGALQRSVPLAGAGPAASPLNAPKQAQRTAVKQAPAPQPVQAPVMPAPPQPVPPPTPAEIWQQLAAVPGAPTIVFDYAQRAAA